MGRKGRSVALMLAGLGLVALSVLADAVVGSGGYAFGWEQKMGVAIGTSLVWLGVLRYVGYSPSRTRRESTQGATHVAPVST